jgi:hypothetical protein
MDKNRIEVLPASLGVRLNPMFGNIAPDDAVQLIFNLSRDGDAPGHWNEEPHSSISNTQLRKVGCRRIRSIPTMNATTTGRGKRRA